MTQKSSLKKPQDRQDLRARGKESPLLRTLTLCEIKNQLYKWFKKIIPTKAGLQNVLPLPPEPRPPRLLLPSRPEVPCAQQKRPWERRWCGVKGDDRGRRSWRGGTALLTFKETHESCSFRRICFLKLIVEYKIWRKMGNVQVIFGFQEVLIGGISDSFDY